MNYLVRLNYLVLPMVRVRVSSVVVSIIQFPLFVGQDQIIQADQIIHHSTRRTLQLVYIYSLVKEELRTPPHL